MAQLQLFELVETLEPGRQSQALLLHWNGHEYTTIDAKPVIVHSYAGSHGIVGDRGYCFLGESGRWETIGSLVSRESFGL